MNIPGEVMVLVFVLIGLIIVAFALVVLRFIWSHIKGPAKAILTLVLVGALVLGVIVGIGWISDPFNRARLENGGSSTAAFVKAWWIMNIGDLPDIAGLIPGTNGGQPKPVAPQTTIDLSGLAEPLPKIPVQINEYALKDLPAFKGSKQTTVEQRDVVVAVRGVVSPTLSTVRTTSTTVGYTNIITDGMPAKMPLNGKVVVLVFRDGTVVLSSRPFSEAVQSWLQSVQRVTGPLLELDEQPEITRRVPKDAPIRRDLRSTMIGMQNLFDFQPELLASVGVTQTMSIKNFQQTQSMTSRIRLASFQVDKCDVAQAPRGIDEGGTPAFRGLVECYNTRVYALDARRIELLWNRDPAKQKQDINGWPEVQKETALTVAGLNKLLAAMKIEVASTTIGGRRLDYNNPADVELVYDKNLFGLLTDVGRKLMALRTEIETP